MIQLVLFLSATFHISLSQYIYIYLYIHIRVLGMNRDEHIVIMDKVKLFVSATCYIRRNGTKELPVKDPMAALAKLQSCPETTLEEFDRKHPTLTWKLKSFKVHRLLLVGWASGVGVGTGVATDLRSKTG